jgi:hypothetical protein
MRCYESQGEFLLLSLYRKMIPKWVIPVDLSDVVNGELHYIRFNQLYKPLITRQDSYTTTYYLDYNLEQLDCK